MRSRKREKGPSLREREGPHSTAKRREEALQMVDYDCAAGVTVKGPNIDKREGKPLARKGGDNVTCAMWGGRGGYRWRTRGTPWFLKSRIEGGSQGRGEGRPESEKKKKR